MSRRKPFDARSALPGSPFLTHISLREDRVQPGVYPFTMPWILSGLDLNLSAPVTFLVGENGTGKSTLLEAIAKTKNAQFVIATHSPMLLTLPGAAVFSLDAEQIRSVAYNQTDHYRITRDFLNAPERYYRHFLEEAIEESSSPREVTRLTHKIQPAVRCAEPLECPPWYNPAEVASGPG